MAATVNASKYDVPTVTKGSIGIGAVAHKSGLGYSSVHSNDGQIQVFVVGELFDAEELIEDQPSIPNGNAATAILALYANDALPRLADSNGLFAAAIMDSNSHRLVLITDRFCGFPIHVHKNQSRIAFAGQIKTLLADPAVPRKVDPDALAQLFTIQRTIGRDTNLAGVDALPAATILTIDADHQYETSYCALQWKNKFRDEEECAEVLSDAMRNAVTRQGGHGSHRPGLLLSGGLDSRMTLASAAPGTLQCWTTASYPENPELEIARRTAAMQQSGFRPAILEPADTLPFFDATTVENNGLYPASVQFSAFMDDVAADCDTVLTGHGLDYTFRGYYLPAKFIRIAGSATRLPSLRAIPKHPTGADVLANLRQGPPTETIQRIVRREKQDAWWHNQAEKMESVLQPWLQSDTPENAWDAFILHSLSKHYAFTGMMAIRAATHLRIPTYDRDVFETYLGMPPAWRIRGHVALRAMEHLSPDLARLENANTGFRANLGPWREIAGLFARGAARRAGILSRPKKPSQSHSAGSWQNLEMLYRKDPAHRKRFAEIRNRLDSLSFGILDCDGLAACIDEHMSAQKSHGKLLRMLLTHDSWVRCFGIAENG